MLSSVLFGKSRVRLSRVVGATPLLLRLLYRLVSPAPTCSARSAPAADEVRVPPLPPRLVRSPPLRSFRSGALSRRLLWSVEFAAPPEPSFYGCNFALLARFSGVLYGLVSLLSLYVWRGRTCWEVVLT